MIVWIRRLKPVEQSFQAVIKVRSANSDEAWIARSKHQNIQFGNRKYLLGDDWKIVHAASCLSQIAIIRLISVVAIFGTGFQWLLRPQAFELGRKLLPDFPFLIRLTIASKPASKEQSKPQFLSPPLQPRTSLRHPLQSIPIQLRPDNLQHPRVIRIPPAKFIAAQQ